jgi:hypothetical protein
VWYNLQMPRIARVAVGDVLYHVINRSNGRVQIFDTDDDYKHFESILQGIPGDRGKNYDTDL